ncbi:hypothetical protein L208DRAFT_1062999, partial [Tricholoma matsutake]
ERQPKFVQEYVWRSDESTYVSTALSSEFAPPFPHPPHNELNNQVALSTLHSHPHLFHITIPINIEHFGTLLVSHPNRALVKSPCHGLKEGFWPWAVMVNSAAPVIINNAVSQKIKNLQHLKFVQEQRDVEMVLRCFSQPFDTLLPGMTIVPLWVVPKLHSDKLRLVVDQSAGDFSPNSFISQEDAQVHLDSLHVLGSTLIRVCEQYGNVPLILFKTDVSQAYRGLPVHPLWQLHQVVTINDKHHVDNND